MLYFGISGSELLLLVPRCLTGFGLFGVWWARCLEFGVLVLGILVFVFRFGGIGFWFCGYFGDFAGFGICLLRVVLCGVGVI